MSVFDDLLDVPGADDAMLLDDLKSLIILADSEKPRSRQKVPGPSEVGHPCNRKLAYLVNRARNRNPEAQGFNTNSDPLAAIMGTALHAWLELAALAANARLGRTRWLTEQRVVVRPGTSTREELAGTCDLYDGDNATALDWKVPGVTTYNEYVKHGPSEQYRGQAHLYGAGMVNFGLPVEHVGIIFICRTATMRKIHLWREEYNPALVAAILDRLDSVEEQMGRYDVAKDPSGFLRIPTTPDHCDYCPWHSLSPKSSFQCEGGHP